MIKLIKKKKTDKRSDLVGQKCNAYKWIELINFIIKKILIEKLSSILTNNETNLVYINRDEFINDMIMLYKPTSLNKKYGSLEKDEKDNKDKDIKKTLNKKYDHFINTISNEKLKNELSEFRNYIKNNIQNKPNLCFLIKNWIKNKYIIYEGIKYSLVLYDHQSGRPGKNKKMDEYKVLCNPYIYDSKIPNNKNITWYNLFYLNTKYQNLQIEVQLFPNYILLLHIINFKILLESKEIKIIRL